MSWLWSEIIVQSVTTSERSTTSGVASVVVVQSGFAETLIVTLTRYLTLNPNPNFGESGRHRRRRRLSVCNVCIVAKRYVL